MGIFKVTPFEYIAVEWLRLYLKSFVNTNAPKVLF